eukprot:363658-Chlamydomonas_euryale.AAC.5
MRHFCAFFCIGALCVDSLAPHSLSGSPHKHEVHTNVRSSPLLWPPAAALCSKRAHSRNPVAGSTYPAEQSKGGIGVGSNFQGLLCGTYPAEQQWADEALGRVYKPCYVARTLRSGHGRDRYWVGFLSFVMWCCSVAVSG